MKPHDLVALFAKACAGADPLDAARLTLEGLRSEVASIAHALSYVPGTGGNARQVFFRSPELTLLKVCFPGGRRTPPHNHGTWAAILLLSGEEKNTLYRNEDGRLRRASAVTLQCGSVLPMRAETVHVAEAAGQAPAIGLHVYGGDIFALPRRMWNPETLQAQDLDWTLYEQFARIASAAAGAPAA